MPRRCVARVLSIVMGGIVAPAALGLDGAFAAADCLQQPAGDTPPGAHWHFHLDRVNNRKCWYLGLTAPAAPQPTAIPDPNPQPRPPSFFSSLFGSPPASPPPPQQVLPGGSTPLAPTGFREEDAATRSPQGSQLYSTASVAKPRRPAKPRPPQVEKDPTQPLTPAERDALFREFLEWKQQRQAQ